MDRKRTLIHWFRKGLRIHDNPAFAHIYQKAKENSDDFYVRPIFILDPSIRDWMRVGSNRLRFLQQSLDDLNKQLININLRLFVIRGKPTEVFPRLFKDWRTCLLTFESDIEPFSKVRDDEVSKLAKVHNVHIESFCSHVIFNPEIVLKNNFGRAPLTYQKFLQLIEKMKAPKSLPTPESFPQESYPEFDEFESANRQCYDCPTLEELVAQTTELGPNKYIGGETEALKRLNTYINKGEWIASFEKPNTSPNSLEPSTTVLSPYLKFGCLSSRLFYEKLSECLCKHKKHSKPPVSLLGQLLWREFYYTVAASEPNFDRMIGNSICLQIPWEENNDYLEAWTYGRTGYPFIDAIMRQLRQEGWIHHLARHAVACFLTRGDLWISWEYGQKVFEELLLDQDWALNAGNWMWLSASAFFHQYFRVYSPVSFGKKTDPTGMYIKKYVPELSNYPSDYIYEPWKVSLKEQRIFGCVLGEDYPHRIVKHEIVYKVNMKRMGDAYKINREVNAGKTRNREADTESHAKKRKMEKMSQN